MKKFKKTAGIILKHKDEVLLCKRSPQKSLPNLWSIPSGHMEEGESPGQSAIREFYEETNIEIDTKIDLVGIIDKFENNGVKRGVMFVFLKNINSKETPNLEEAKDGFEHSECKYFTHEKLPEQKQNKDLIELIKKILK